MTDFKQNTNLGRPAFLVRTKSLREILSDLRKAELWLMVAALAAFLASAFFVVKYFVGGEMTPDLWSSEQWMNAFLGLGITAVITAAQAFLYSSGYKGHAALIATFVVVFFGVFSEVSQSMEREDATVRSRSENSAVFQATLGSISTLSSAPSISSAAASELARARQKAMEIQTRIDNKNRCKSCETLTFRRLRTMLTDANGRVAAAQARADMEMKAATTANAVALQSAISTAKQLEYDEDKHYAMIRLLKSLFGVTGIWASFLFSIIIIGTFEYAFHFVGAYVADHKSALLMLGRDTQGRRLDNANPVPAAADMQEGKGPIPQDHGNNLREEYLDWVSPDRVGQAANEQATDAPAVKVAREDTADKANDFTRKRFYKLIYTEVRNLILNGDIKPTVRPVTDAVTTIIRHKSHLLGIKPSMMGKPQRQQIAQSILEHLEQETVVMRNKEGGVGKPKYVLAPQYIDAIKHSRDKTQVPEQAQLV
ncbi:MAG: hypothetical protein ACPGSM_03810 [Thiolinea sp.]